MDEQLRELRVLLQGVEKHLNGTHESKESFTTACVVLDGIIEDAKERRRNEERLHANGNGSAVRSRHRIAYPLWRELRCLC